MRALGVIRLSKTADPASTSLERQREIVTGFIESQGWDPVGFAEDKATSAFKIPPHERKQIAAWLARPDDFDTIVYWRQDRIVRRTADFIGLITWCKANGKSLFSATEGTGDVTQHANELVGFISAWQAEGESRNTSIRVTGSRKKLLEAGRWPGGRVPYGFRLVRVKGQPGWYLAEDPKTGPHLREAVRRVLDGQSPNSIIADFNRRGIAASDGGRWNTVALRKMLRSDRLADLVGPTVRAEVQLAMDGRTMRRYSRTTGHQYLTLGLVFCGMCGAPVYITKHPTRLYGRCRNELKRAETATICRMRHVPYDDLHALLSAAVLLHRDDDIEMRQTTGSRRVRMDAVNRELMSLNDSLVARKIDRADHRARQDALLDELDELERAENAPAAWAPTGETVGQRWDRLSDAERRLWLLGIGAKFTLTRELSPDGALARWRLESDWRTGDEGARRRERIGRPNL